MMDNEKMDREEMAESTAEDAVMDEAAALEDASDAAEGTPSEEGGQQPAEDEGASGTSEADKEESEEEKESADARYMRLAADFQNFKRRTQQEKADIYNRANEKIALDIIEVMDSFERAMASSDSCEDRKFVEGVEMIYKQLKAVLDRNNVLEIESNGAAFDPNFHSAVMAEENPDFESGMVIDTLQKGYTLNGKVIRPSMVRVAQ